MSQRAKHWALLVKRDVRAIYCAARDPRVPWYAKALARRGVGPWAIPPQWWSPSGQHVSYLQDGSAIALSWA